MMKMPSRKAPKLASQNPPDGDGGVRIAAAEVDADPFDGCSQPHTAACDQHDQQDQRLDADAATDIDLVAGALSWFSTNFSLVPDSPIEQASVTAVDAIVPPSPPLGHARRGWLKWSS